MSITKGHSTIIEFGDAETHTDSSVWVKLARVTEVTPPRPEAADIDVSHMDSPEQFNEFDPGWADAGELEFALQFEKEQAETVYGFFRQKKGYRVVFVDGSQWALTGYIKSFGDEIDREGIITSGVTVKVSGKPEFVKASD